MKLHFFLDDKSKHLVFLCSDGLSRALGVLVPYLEAPQRPVFLHFIFFPYCYYSAFSFYVSLSLTRGTSIILTPSPHSKLTQIHKSNGMSCFNLNACYFLLLTMIKIAFHDILLGAVLHYCCKSSYSLNGL